MDSDPHHRPLWAPWRIDYILRDKEGNDPGCFLCDKANDPANDEANGVVARGECCYVLLNTYPYNSGHVMIAPYRHISRLDDLNADERTEMMDLLARAQDTLTRAMEPEGFNMGCNIGKAAGAAIEDHLHWHLVPRWCGDTNFMPVLADVDCVPQALEATTRLLRDAWRD